MHILSILWINRHQSMVFYEFIFFVVVFERFSLLTQALRVKAVKIRKQD